jgi:nitrate/nitrite transporter NarK
MSYVVTSPLNKQTASSDDVTPLIKPKRIETSYRQRTGPKYFALILMCFLTFGKYYAYDNPQALQNELTSTLSLSSLEYNLLYSVYSFPNMILPLVGGFIVDFLGVRFGIILFSVLIIIGQSLITMGGYMNSYAVILMGRIVFGLGGENCGVVQSKICCKWFKKREVAFALSMATAVSRAGSAANSFITPKLYNGNLGFPLLVSDMICILSLIGGFIVVYMDRKSDEIEGIQDTGEKDSTDQVKVSDVCKLTSIYWVAVITCMGSYGSINGFLNVGNDYIQTRFGFNSSTAGDLLSIYYGISIFTTPASGILADRIGNRALLMVIGNILLIAGQLTMALIPSCDQCYTLLAPISIMGCFIGLYAAVFWGVIPLVVDQRYLGTAFGMTYTLQNTSWAIFPFAVSQLQNISYADVSIFLTFVATASLICCLILMVLDKKRGGNLKKVYKEEDM